ncbi:Sodium/proton antiporter ChaA [Planctomycetes bacterium Pan216]|uniref:Sodium/proton antiporter ChaA n=1 Tax=Kolteria novifilia TaxID=2527975 RepID=A0A518B3X3_9BACT|nr:Sodium/proton antiporter ChaA [Planctomycetes bacterium Pan216]
MTNQPQPPPNVLRSEGSLWIGTVTTILFLIFGKSWLVGLSSPSLAGLFFVWLFVVILWLAFSVVRHADCLAIKLGEPYGTLVLTISVVGIEAVMIAAVMLTGEENPTLARDTMFSLIMIVLNGLLGLTLLLGGMRHHEQSYNLSGAVSYLGVLTPLSVLSLIVPSFTDSTPGGSVSRLMGFFLLFMSLGLYLVFLFLQTNRHSRFFMQPEDGPQPTKELHGHEGLVPRSTRFHALFLVLSMLPIVLLAKSMAKVVSFGIDSLGAPPALGGFLVAILVLAPEGMSAIKAALDNQLQRTINLSLGAATSSIGMTVPAILAISLFTGRELELGLDPLQIVLLSLTLLLSVISFTTGRTNVLQGVVHLIVFASYVVLIFD